MTTEEKLTMLKDAIRTGERMAAGKDGYCTICSDWSGHQPSCPLYPIAEALSEVEAI